MLHFYYRVTNQNMNDFLCSTVSPLFISLISELIAMLHDLRKKKTEEKKIRKIYFLPAEIMESFIYFVTSPQHCVGSHQWRRSLIDLPGGKLHLLHFLNVRLVHGGGPAQSRTD